MSSQRDDQYRVYGYRWVVLAAAMFANLTMQMLWIGYAPIISQAARYYHVSRPAHRPARDGLHDRLHPALAAGGLGHRHARISHRRRARRRCSWVSSASLAAWQARTTPSCCCARSASPSRSRSCSTPGPRCRRNWFAPAERATAVGLTTLASMLGIAVGMVLSPLLVEEHVDRQHAARLRRAGGGVGGRLPAAGARAAGHAALPARHGRRAPSCSTASSTRSRVKPFLVILGVALRASWARSTA